MLSDITCVNVETSAAAPGPAVDAVDIDKAGEYNGQPLFNLDLEALEDKPWRKPGFELLDAASKCRRGCYGLL